MLRHMEGRKVIQESQHGFTRDKSCLIKLVVFYDSVIASMNRGGATDVIYFNFTKAFDTLLHDILFSKLERYGFNGWIVQWTKYCVQG